MMIPTLYCLPAHTLLLQAPQPCCWRCAAVHTCGALFACTRLAFAGTATLSLVLCDDPHIRALNYQHRNKDAPTDVLSFEMGDELAYKVRYYSVIPCKEKGLCP